MWAAIGAFDSRNPARECESRCNFLLSKVYLAHGHVKGRFTSSLIA